MNEDDQKKLEVEIRAMFIEKFPPATLAQLYKSHLVHGTPIPEEFEVNK